MSVHPIIRRGRTVFVHFPELAVRALARAAEAALAPVRTGLLAADVPADAPSTTDH